MVPRIASRPVLLLLLPILKGEKEFIWRVPRYPATIRIVVMVVCIDGVCTDWRAMTTKTTATDPDDGAVLRKRPLP
ncbi:hypothetical protein DdX_07317 [Ditylenchus destructor]|uniref:Uncharacterized protein n=1 Tax=Ditylenchus destructor TaxID=166010 RepID=A0AAD4N7D3_9BILA|nr:hypothetical protein DdX_07317 [Ditylenchus destructor]